METVGTLGLKRKFVEVDSGSPFSTPKDSDDDISSSDSADSCDSLNAPSSSFTPTSILRRPRPSLGRKRVRFDSVTVYYFSRRQGFTSVPSQGGSSLGMARHHCDIRHYTLGEFAREQESSHRLALRQHLRQEKLNARKMKLTRNGTVECAQADLLTLDDVSDEDLDVESVEVDDCFFLQPLPTKRRRALLRASGINRIDAREKAELRAIRLSREECGCDCRFYCDPRHCGCSQAGIKCQVDRMSFPCGCSREGCGNAAGRIEFNPLRVRTHYLHTIMKLDLEKRGLLGDALDDEAPTPSPSMSPSLSPGSELEADARAVQELLAEHDSLERENETAVLHLQSAEERERLREQEQEEVEVELEVQHEDPTLCLLAGQLVEEARAEAMEGMLIQGAFPEGAALLCISDGQVSQVSQVSQSLQPVEQQQQQELQQLESEPELQRQEQEQEGEQKEEQEGCFLKHQPATPLLYYQIDQLEAKAFQPHTTAEPVDRDSTEEEQSTEGTVGRVGIQVGGGDVENKLHELSTSEQSSEKTLPVVAPCPESRREEEMSCMVVPVPESKIEEGASAVVAPCPESKRVEETLSAVFPVPETREEEEISPVVVPHLERREETEVSPVVVPHLERREETEVSPVVVPHLERREETEVSPVVVPQPESRGEEKILSMVVPCRESRGEEESPSQREESLDGPPCQQVCLMSDPDALALPTEV